MSLGCSSSRPPRRRSARSDRDRRRRRRLELGEEQRHAGGYSRARSSATQSISTWIADERRADGRSRRPRLGEEGLVHRVHPRELVEVGEEDATAHDVGEGGAGALENRPDVLERQPGLLLDRLADDLAVDDRALTRDEQEASFGDDPRAVRPHRGRAGDWFSHDASLSAGGRRSACASSISATSASMPSSVSVAAVFGSSIAACRTWSRRPSSAARTVRSRDVEERPVERRAAAAAARRRAVGLTPGARRPGTAPRRRRPRAGSSIRPVLSDVAVDDPRRAGLDRVDDLRRVLDRGSLDRRAARPRRARPWTPSYSSRFSSLRRDVLGDGDAAGARSRRRARRNHGRYSAECSLDSVGK